jgi:GNAT superfamily N-acetyltransferase
MSVRVAEPADALAVAAVHVRSWQVGYEGLLSGEYLDRLRAEDRASQYRFVQSVADDPETIVALRDETIRGFATIGRAEGQAIEVGELRALYVDPGSWRMGVGRELIVASRQRLVKRGCKRATLWVLRGNARAVAFYRSDGWVSDGTSREDEVWGLSVEEERFWRDL